MTDVSYDPETDAVYITVGHSNIDRTEEAGPFIYDIALREQGSGARGLEKSPLVQRSTRERSRIDIILAA